MRSWVEVPAQIERAELQEHDGGDATTYKAVATYRYEYAGRSYTGNRVAISATADNIGDFHRDLYSRLRAAQSRGRPVTAYVDPANPAEATLNRDLRWLVLTLQGVIALVFGGVGFGLLFGARYGAKKLAAERALQAQFPREPWRWRKEWAGGRIHGAGGATALAATLFALLWNLISLPAAIFLSEELAKGNWLAIIGLLFPLIGIGLAAWAVRAWWQLRRFKTATLTLPRLPVPLGGTLHGSIRVDAEVPVTEEFRFDLSCIEKHSSGRADNRETNERLVWQTQWTVPRSRCQISSAFTTIPVEVAVPGDQPAASTVADGDRVTWRLDVTGECPGPDFWNRFELPVFDTGERPADERDSPAESVSAERPTAKQLDRLGIVYERLPQGGEAWTFRRARHKGVAAGLTLFGVIWTAATLLLFNVDAPVIMPIVFALLDVPILCLALSLWLTQYRVTLDDRVLTLVRRGLLRRGPIEIPRQWVKRVRASRGMQAGNKLYYDLRVDSPDGTYTAASSIGDYQVASWLANYWGGR